MGTSFAKTHFTMFPRFTLSLTATALVIGTFALSQAQPKSNPKSKSVAATGIVAGAPSATEFQLRTSGGVYRVKFHAKVNMKEIQGGDQVRVFGHPLGRVFYDANVRLLRAKASNSPDDYSRPTVERLDGKPREGANDKGVNTR